MLLNVHCYWYYCCFAALKVSPYGQDKWHSEVKACGTVDMMTSAKYCFMVSTHMTYTMTKRNELLHDVSQLHICVYLLKLSTLLPTTCYKLNG